MSEHAANATCIVLVEGISDCAAVETLAERLGRNLTTEGIAVVATGGAHAIDQYVSVYSRGDDIELVGLCDFAEAGYFASALAGRDLTGRPADIATLEDDGIFVCNLDLEEELIRSMDQSAIESLLADQGDLGAFRTLQKQPQWRGQPFAAQMQRWLSAGSGRKTRYAKLFVLGASAERLPPPLVALMAYV